MATMNPSMPERRHVPDRRSDSRAHAGTRNRMAGSNTSDVHGYTDTSHQAKNRMTAAEWIPMLLLIVGGLNWGLVGLFDFNLVASLFGEGTTLSRAVYIAVGLSALYSLYLSAKMSRNPD